MFCGKCGKELKEGAKFCTSCGQPIQRQAPVHDSETPVKVQMHQPVIQNEKQIQSSVGDSKEVLEGQEKKGIWALVILLIILVLVALGCLFYIICLQKNDSNNIYTGEEDTVQARDNQEYEDNKNESGEQVPDGENERAEAAIGTAPDYLEMAWEAYSNNDYERALQYCGMARQADNLNEEAYSLEADIYLEQQEFEQAASILNEGIVATDSNDLKYNKEQLVMNVITTACSQYNSLGTLICEVEYDTYGNAIRYISYSDGKNIYSIEECGYDSWGRIVSKNHYNGSMMFEWQEEYVYNSGGYVSECTYYNALGKKEWTDEYLYDSNGRQIQTTRYNADGTLSWWDEYTYLSNENVIKTAHPSTGETVVIQITCVFDLLGNQTEYAEYDASGACTYAWQKEYNGLDDVTKYIYGDSEINYIYDYVYK